LLQVSCGSRDAQTLALVEGGLVYSFGDGDFGESSEFFFQFFFHPVLSVCCAVVTGLI